MPSYRDSSMQTDDDYTFAKPIGKSKIRSVPRTQKQVIEVVDSILRAAYKNYTDINPDQPPTLFHRALAVRYNDHNTRSRPEVLKEFVEMFKGLTANDDDVKDAVSDLISIAKITLPKNDPRIIGASSRGLTHADLIRIAVVKVVRLIYEAADRYLTNWSCGRVPNLSLRPASQHKLVSMVLSKRPLVGRALHHTRLVAGGELKVACVGTSQLDLNAEAKRAVRMSETLLKRNGWVQTRVGHDIRWVRLSDAFRSNVRAKLWEREKAFLHSIGVPTPLATTLSAMVDPKFERAFEKAVARRTVLRIRRGCRMLESMRNQTDERRGARIPTLTASTLRRFVGPVLSKGKRRTIVKRFGKGMYTMKAGQHARGELPLVNGREAVGQSPIDASLASPHPVRPPTASSIPVPVPIPPLSAAAPERRTTRTQAGQKLSKPEMYNPGRVNSQPQTLTARPLPSIDEGAAGPVYEAMPSLGKPKTPSVGYAAAVFEGRKTAPREKRARRLRFSRRQYAPVAPESNEMFAARVMDCPVSGVSSEPIRLAAAAIKGRILPTPSFLEVMGAASTASGEGGTQTILPPSYAGRSDAETFAGLCRLAVVIAVTSYWQRSGCMPISLTEIDALSVFVERTFTETRGVPSPETVHFDRINAYAATCATSIDANELVFLSGTEDPVFDHVSDLVRTHLDVLVAIRSRQRKHISRIKINSQDEGAREVRVVGYVAVRSAFYLTVASEVRDFAAGLPSRLVHSAVESIPHITTVNHDDPSDPSYDAIARAVFDETNKWRSGRHIEYTPRGLKRVSDRKLFIGIFNEVHAAYCDENKQTPHNFHIGTYYQLWANKIIDVLRALHMPVDLYDESVANVVRREYKVLIRDFYANKQREAKGERKIQYGRNRKLVIDDMVGRIGAADADGYSAYVAQASAAGGPGIMAHSAVPYSDVAMKVQRPIVGESEAACYARRAAKRQKMGVSAEDTATVLSAMERVAADIEHTPYDTPTNWLPGELMRLGETHSDGASSATTTDVGSALGPESLVCVAPDGMQMWMHMEMLPPFEGAIPIPTAVHTFRKPVYAQLVVPQPAAPAQPVAAQPAAERPGVLSGLDAITSASQSLPDNLSSGERFKALMALSRTLPQ